MKNLENLYNSFVSAWDMVMDVSLPGTPRRDYFEEDAFGTAVMIPVVGAVPGIILAALGLFCRGSVAGSLIWAFAALVVMELINSGRSGRFAAEKISALIFRGDAEKFCSSATTLIMIFKLAALYALSFCGNTGFAVLFFVLVFAFQMYCAVFPVENALIQVEDEKKSYLYIFPSAVAFLWFWSYPAATLLCLGAVCGIAVFFRKKVWIDSGAINGDDITLAAGFVELILLLCAIIFPGI